MAATQALEITHRPEGAPLVTSYQQERLWFLQEYAPESTLYNLPRFMRLTGTLDVAAWERSIGDLIRRHEGFRTTFPIIDGRPVLLIGEPGEFKLDIVDLSEKSPEEQQAEIERRIEIETRTPFNLATGPLFRAGMLRIGLTEHVYWQCGHHIISDAWSSGALNRELSALYGAYVTGDLPNLPDLALQYSDYAYWQRQWIEGGGYDGQVAYWTKQLAGSPPTLDLMTDRPRTARRTNRGARLSNDLPPALTAEIKAFSRSEKVTVFMTMLAAYNTLLMRYTGQQDITIGSLIANRNAAELESIVGYFVNTLVMRTDLSGAPSFRELLARVRKVSLEAFSNQDIPFEKLIEVLRPERDTSHTPLFQVMINMRSRGRGQLKLPNLEIEYLNAETGLAKFDLSLEMEDNGDTITCRWEYDTDLFDAATIEGMHKHFDLLLQNAIAKPDYPIGQLDILGSEDRQRLLFDWNGKPQNLHTDTSLRRLLEAQVKRTPDATAYIFESEHLSYADLNRRVNQLAHLIQQHQIGAGSVVGVGIEPSLDMVIALMAVVKAGAAYLPLDPAYPAERLNFTLVDSDARMVITRNNVLVGLETEHLIVIDVARDAALIGQQSTQNLPDDSKNPADDPVYILYTSGSTGKPKGVFVASKAVLNRSRWLWDAYPFEPNEVAALKTSLNFGDSIWEIWGALLQGKPTLIVTTDVVRDPWRLVETLAENKVTRLWVVPSFLETILDSIPDLQERLPLLRFWVSSGEALPLPLLKRFQEAMPNATLYNSYGTSEFLDVTWYVPQPQHAMLTHVPMGKPITNCQLYILDANKQLVPVGVPGELYVGGDQLPVGYHKRPELTAARLVPNPFSSEPNVKLFRTGDLVRWMYDGHIQYFHRSDYEVKIRGFRVDPAEIENVLATHPSIVQCAIVACKDTHGHMMLAAYIVVDKASADIPGIQQHLRRKLPDYMIPSAFVTLPEIPRTESGKLDRKALPAPNLRAANEQVAITEPRNETEHQIAAIWREMLGVERIGIHDNFFNVGGHSLLAVKLLTRIHKETGKRIPLATLFNAATIAQQAKMVRRSKRVRSSVLVPIQPNGTRPPLFCLHALHGGAFIYKAFSDILGPDQPIYGLQAVGIDGGEKPQTKVEEMAATYIEAIRKVQTDGPYYICGYSFGTVLAFEVASQLRESGYEVAFLGLIDTLLQAKPRLLITGKLAQVAGGVPAALIQKVYAFISGLMLLPRGFKLRYLRQSLRTIRNNFNHQIKGRPQPKPRKKLPPNIERIKRASYIAARSYTPRPYSGHVVYLRGLHNSINIRVFRELDRIVQGNLEIHEVPGTHYNLMSSPQVEGVAHHIKAYLDRLYSTK